MVVAATSVGCALSRAVFNAVWYEWFPRKRNSGERSFHPTLHTALASLHTAVIIRPWVRTQPALTHSLTRTHRRRTDKPHARAQTHARTHGGRSLSHTHTHSHTHCDTPSNFLGRKDVNQCLEFDTHTHTHTHTLSLSLSLSH